MVKKNRSEIFSWIKAIGISIILAVVVKNFIFANYLVKGESMNPTLHNGNRLIVNKVNYDFSMPKHGEIIIFHATSTKDYVKRVIGLPGDTIVYQNDQLYRNGKKVDEPYLDKYKKKLSNGQLDYDFSLEELTGKQRVPKGKLWVMGDNRRNSSDSREFGFIDIDQVVGKVSLRYYPFSEVNVYSASK
ncbi:signal peptidase I [Pullulanibacillus pueri]|uniref:Signal peptidase I n=1 Tax=Pullulanibacillus pueri TaxID=1437324 RepID=A0A8J2ZW89_9BACL|nr:signal peptidase I [Pullulanibacillus pueri]MBM7680895.1 signal peptidase I [Pullulanibacillus pueri]GGH81242.1 signal peptidase I [Pullulanibacillus pueri]